MVELYKMGGRYDGALQKWVGATAEQPDPPNLTMDGTAGSVFNVL